ncbi:MAG TPA: cytochrome P450 [Actinophytocola sp.]|uniref:cytochrome P450 n=1 Tax=Actinophytocola sp. TaxID=1872138 RepID=UPI002DBFEE76|nr:cytochrome P450 [Actinophytocola sp.]HEU5475190.1 cytochrome P450 [Actinophytocola sp.]
MDATVAGLAADPHPVLARLRAGGPVSWVPALNAWLVTRYDLAVRVMRDPATFTVDDPRFSTARVVGPSMLSLDGPEHARHREPFGAPFRRPAVRARFTGFIESEVDRLVGAIRPAGTAELRAEVAGPLAVAVLAEALGLSDVDVSTVRSWYAALVVAVSEVTAGHAIPAPAHAAVDALRRAVQRTLAASGPSLLAEAADRLRPAEIVSNAAVLLFGGIDTTEGMITNAVLHLLTHPEARAAVTADPALLPNAVEESLRLEPAAAVVDRYATRDIAMAGARIRRGDLVTVSLAAANRDPAVFPDPDRFDLHRPNARAHLAFAKGPHFCPGAQLARTETLCTARVLLTLPALHLPDPPTPHGLVFRKPRALHARWTR